MSSTNSNKPPNDGLGLPKDYFEKFGEKLRKRLHHEGEGMLVPENYFNEFQERISNKVQERSSGNLMRTISRIAAIGLLLMACLFLFKGAEHDKSNAPDSYVMLDYLMDNSEELDIDILYEYLDDEEHASELEEMIDYLEGEELEIENLMDLI